jgi:hypothetical protein
MYLSLIPFSFAQIKGNAVIEWTDKKEMSLRPRSYPLFRETVSIMMPIRKLYFTP